jgi:ubiquinone biosynthesis protein
VTNVTAVLPRKRLHLRRFRQVAGVLTRHGFGFVLGGRRVHLPGRQRDGRSDELEAVRPEQLRLALEELGITFVKLGQVLSTRADLLPPAYRAELSRLQDHAPAVPFADVRGVVEAALGRPLEELFATFEPVPLATGSIGQAHAATLAGGESVVVKVRRPGAVEQVEEDLEILEGLARAVARRSSVARRYDVTGLVREFAATLRAELDYVREGHNAERFAANFADEPDVHVPRVVWQRTTERVLTLERIEGIKINDAAALDAAGVARSKLAERLAEIVLTMTLEDGFFHADPHPGNFFVEPGGRIGLIDFGMVGTVDAATREALVDVAYAVGSGDADRAVEGFLALGVAGQVDREALRRDVADLLDRYRGRPLGEIAMAPLLGEALTVMRRHELRLPANLALLLKTLMMAEGLGAGLAPDFKLTPLLEPFAGRLLLQRYAPAALLRRLGRAGLESLKLAEELPPQLRRLLQQVERGQLQVGIRAESVEPVVGRLERLANRLVLGMIVSSFIVGLAVLVAVYRPAGWVRWADTAFAIGLLIATVAGGYLAWVILRSGKA